MRSKFSMLGAAALSLFVSACNDRLDPPSRVVDLRVLAVQADLPYAHPGETVHVDALGLDPDGRALTWGWTTCKNPRDSTALACLEALGDASAAGEDVELVTGTDLAQFDVNVDDDAITSLPRHLQDRATIGVVAVLCPGTLEPRLASETSNEFPLPVVCRDADSGERLGPFDFITGVKRLFVRNEDRNANPELDAITFDGKPWAEDDVPTVAACDVETNVVDDCPERTHHEVAARVADGATESGIDEYGARFDEQVVVQYYASEGTFEDDVRVDSDPETKWVATSKAKGRELTFWFVVRDDRGGVSWVTRKLQVEE